MSNQCKIVPDAPNGKPSKLFQELRGRLKNREMAKMAWGFTQTPLFKSEFSDIEMDENGEPTFDALDKILNLGKMQKESEADMGKAQSLSLVDSFGEPQKFSSAEVVLGKAKEFNESAKQKIAVVQKDEDGKYFADIQQNTPMAMAQADRNEARRQLNTTLISLIQKIGFNVDFVEDSSSHSFFDPMEADANAQNLKTVIRIVNGEQGLEELPEEVCHLVIAGLKDNPLKQRLDTICTDAVVRRVLGDQYDYYAKQYKDGNMPLEERLREEAEGQMLASMLKHNKVIVKESSSILSRIWDKVKSFFKLLKTDDVDNAIINAENVLRPIASKIQDRSIETILDRDAIMAHERMYHLFNEIEDLESLAHEGEVLLSKKLSILQNTATTTTATKELMNDIRVVRKSLLNSNYENACYKVMRTAAKDITGLMRELDSMGWIRSDSTDLNVISAEAGLVERISTVIQGYTPYIDTVARLQELIDAGKIEMDPRYIAPIIEKAEECQKMLKTLKDDLHKMRFAVLRQLITLYYGDMGQKPESFTETDKIKWQSVTMILNGASEDIGFLDTRYFSAGDSRNPLINVVHNIIVKQQAKRNQKIMDYCAKMQAADTKLRKAGYSSDFIYQHDENGIPTGYYVGPYDVNRYEKDRTAFIESLDKDDTLSYEAREQLILDWEKTHTTQIKSADGTREYIPKLEIYGTPNFKDGWSDAQKEYYSTVMELKAEMDAMLPVGLRNRYLAPQVRKSITQVLDKDAKSAWSTIWGRLKKKFAVVEDNTDYADKRHILLDFAGRPVKRVPIYYATKLEDLRDLSTDATHAMFSYITMSVNRAEMGQLASAMRLLQEHMSTQYEVKQTRGGKILQDVFYSLGRRYNRDYTKVGSDTRVARELNEFIDRTMFNDTKAEIGSVSIGDKELSGDVAFNLFMEITSKARMGFNALSGITNVTQGETQMFCEAASGRYFNIKDTAWAKKEYGVLLPEYLASFNDADRHDKLFMLINQFNSSEDFFRDMQDRDFNKNPFKRVIGRGNVYFLNTAGEHYLHTSGMLCVLNHEKVRRKSDPKKEVSLYDVIRQVHDEDGWRLELDDDIIFDDKNKAFLQGFAADASGKVTVSKDDRIALFANLSTYINNINASMHGGYSEAEKGNINRKAGGRLLLQFRQWMFGMYNKNFSRPYYDAVTGTVKEGTYYTMWKFLTGTLHDMKNMSIKMAIENNRLNYAEKQNAKVALVQSMLFVFLVLLCRGIKDWKDEDDRALRLMAYSAQRLKLETGALVPWPPTFVKNITTLLKSPAAGFNTFETLATIFDWESMSSELQSGRYKGWNKGLKALYTLTPIYNVQKIVDMKDYNYMFNIFK